MFLDIIQNINPAVLEFIAATGFMVLLGVIFFIMANSRRKPAANTMRNASASLAVFGIISVYALISVALANINTNAVQKAALDMNPITLWFIGVILSFAVYFHFKYTPAIIHKAPAILTTLGILGTFVGIAIGLEKFDANDVQKSVPALIDGIKTAFWASACGILCALTIKLRDALLDSSKKTARTTPAGASINDLVAQLRSVQQALVGSDEFTLANQIRLARQDSNDRLDRIHHSLSGQLAMVLSQKLVEDHVPPASKPRIAFEIAR